MLAAVIGVLFFGMLMRFCQKTWQETRQQQHQDQHQDQHQEEDHYRTNLLCDALPCTDLPCYHVARPPPAAEEPIPVAEPVALTENGHHPECCICLEPMVHSRRTPLKMMPCGHLYHQRCILDWLRTENQIPCPQCGYDRIDYSRQITQ